MSAKKACTIIAFALLISLGAPAAKSSSYTIYCTGGNTCATTQPTSGGYWTLLSDITTTTGTPNTFTYELTVSETNETNPGYVDDFAAQLFYGSGASVSNLSWYSSALNPGGWGTPLASKAGNDGSCQGGAKGSACAAVEIDKTVLGNPVQVTSGGVSFELTGDYTGTFLSNDAFDLQAAATKNADGSGGNVFAVSQTLNDSMTTPTVPEPSSLLLLGSGLVGLAVLFRKRLMPLRRSQ